MAYVKNGPEPSELDLSFVQAISDSYGGLARSARFLARINGKPGTFLSSSNNLTLRHLPYLCESAEFPTRQLMYTEIRYYGPNFKMPYQTNYQDLNLIFICRNNFPERELFDNWLEYINPGSTYDFTYKDDYAATIELFQLSEYRPADEGGQTAQYKFTFEKAYPLEIAAQPVTWADDNFHRLQVTFTFNRWRREGLDQTSLGPYNPVIGSEPGTGNQITPRIYVPGTGTSG